MSVTLDLTKDELAVLRFLVTVDPDWGEPLKDIEDEDDAPRNPYGALKTLKRKVTKKAK